MRSSGPRRFYAHLGLDGLVSRSIAKMTGREVGIYAADQAGMECDSESPWATVCEDHGTIVCHSSLALARESAPVPDWCEDCQREMDASTPVPDFGERYRFTIVRGEIYDYERTLRAAIARVFSSPLPKMRETSRGELRWLVVESLHDDAFLRPLGGMIPARIVEAIEDRVWRKISGIEHVQRN